LQLASAELGKLACFANKAAAKEEDCLALISP
jgi:hypothetical protein